MLLNRRALLAAAAMPAPAAALPAPAIVDLWPGPPPGGSGPGKSEGVSANGAINYVSRPRLVVYRPARPNGTAVIVIAGGGYVRIEAGNESSPAARWLQTMGVTAFELIYRLPQAGRTPAAPLQDGQRAVRVVRAAAASYGLDPTRLGMMGFSAGGHLAGMTAVGSAAPLYQPTDAADGVSARPDFAALIYPVLTLMPPFDHTRTRRELVGPRPDQAASAAYSVPLLVGPSTPPTFLAQAANDPISPVANSLLMFNALLAAHVVAELHIFQSGGHGWGIGRPGTEVHAWPSLFISWASQNGWLPAAAQNG